MNKILVNKEFGFSGVGNGTDVFNLAEAFYFDKLYLVEVRLLAQLPAGLMATVRANGGDLIIEEGTPYAEQKIKFNYPTNSVSITVERKLGATEEGPFTGNYSLCISAYGE